MRNRQSPFSVSVFLGGLFILLIDLSLSIWFATPISIDALTPSGFQLQNVPKIENLSISITINPDAISVGGSGNLILKMANSGNLNTIVKLVQLAPPWNQTNIMQNIVLSPDRTTLQLIQVKVPENASSGAYNLVVKASTVSRDYDGFTVLNVKRIETLPLSDNIPLSILVLIFSGVITYSVAAYIITRNFQRSYVEIGLWSIGLGFLNWGFLYALESAFKGQTTLELIQYDLYSVASIILIGFLVGTVAGIIQKYLISVTIARLGEKKATKEQGKSYLQKGFWQPKQRELIWPHYVSNQWKIIKQQLGTRYGTTLTIYLKDPVNTKTFLTGVLRNFARDISYHLQSHQRNGKQGLRKQQIT
jgi:hypothetical protein